MTQVCAYKEFDANTYYSWEPLAFIRDVAVAAGWEVWDDSGLDETSTSKTVIQWIVLHIDMSEGEYGDEHAYVMVRKTSSNLSLYLYESWDADAHIGGSAYSPSRSLVYNSDRQLYVGADKKYLWLWPRYGAYTNGSTFPPILVTGFERLPNDTVDLSTTVVQGIRVGIVYSISSSPGILPSIHMPLIGGTNQVLSASNAASYNQYGPKPYHTDQNGRALLMPALYIDKAPAPYGDSYECDYVLGTPAGFYMAPYYGLPDPPVALSEYAILPGSMYPNASIPEWLYVGYSMILPWCGDNYH